jgi:hypothetical protein
MQAIVKPGPKPGALNLSSPIRDRIPSSELGKGMGLLLSGYTSKVSKYPNGGPE